jgi:hypothetical protein
MALLANTNFMQLLVDMTSDIQVESVRVCIKVMCLQAYFKRLHSNFMRSLSSYLLTYEKSIWCHVIYSSQLAVNSIRVIECLARDFNEGKHVLGERQDLMKTLVKLKYTGAELLANAASIAMNQLSKDCDVNAGTFRRLRVDYAK